MKTLVTGATGFIGSHLIDLLLEKNYDVVATVRKTSNLRWLKDKPVRTIDGGAFDSDSLKAELRDADIIFHVAGVTFGSAEEDFMKGNRDATSKLLETAANHCRNLKKFVFVSSQTVAGPSASLDRPVTEDMAPNPLTAYARSKKAAEDVVLQYRDKLPITILRAPAVYGPRDEAIFPIFKSVKMGLATLIGFNNKYLSLMHGIDLCRGIYSAAMSERTTGEIYFITSSKFYSWSEVMTEIKNAFGRKNVLMIRLPHSIVLAAAAATQFAGKFMKKPPVFNYEKGVDFIQDYWICSPEKARRDFGFEQTMTLAEGVRDAVEWYKRNKWL
ncbi:MAG: NAD-dependent epimerase/dehydratase family protein [Chloroflexota bacterium]